MTIRKRIGAPPVPEPEERINELKKFVALLADRFIDYDRLDVYDSVFRSRVDTIVETVGFDETSRHIEELGEYIRATNSTKVRDFMKFFQICIEYMESRAE
jgi:hypothetical protein